MAGPRSGARGRKRAGQRRVRDARGPRARVL